MRSVGGIGRLAVIAALIVGGVALGLVIFGGGGYEVTARFSNASQLVKGNNVQIGGVKAGSVTSIDIGSDGMAEIGFNVDEEFAPLPRGTKVTVRQASQSGIANRYVDIRLPSQDQRGDDIPEGAVIPSDETQASVDLDQLFNTLDPPTRKGLQGFFKGTARMYAGRGAQANEGLKYLNPALSSSSRLFSELSRDDAALERFVVDSSKLVGALADRRDDLAGLVQNLNATTRALGGERVALAEAIHNLPPFMRRANSTFVNLRAALDDVDPLVNASKPVARKLRPFLNELRPLARDAKPTVRDLDAIIRRPGANNDLTELTRSFGPLAEAALDTKVRNGKERRGSFPESSEALRRAAPLIAHGRPYTQDFLGWFDDFSTSGEYDGLGGWSRSQVYFNAFNSSALVQSGAPLLIPLQQRANVYESVGKTNQFKRCPGASEEPAADGSNVLSEAEQKEYDCLESHRATGAE